MENRDIIADAGKVKFTRTKSAGAFCECYEYDTIEEEVENMDILFLGKATGPSVAIGTDETGLELFATPFRTSETLKGRLPAKFKLVHPQDSQACGYEFPVNEEILWCAYRGDRSGDDAAAVYYTDGCAAPQFTIGEYRDVLG